MAQLVERLIRNQQIVSSNLTGGSIRYKGLRRRYLRKPFFFFFFFFFFFLALFPVAECKP